MRDGGVTGLGLSVTSSSGISNLSPKESHSNFNEEIHHQDQFNVLSFSDLKEERNSSKEFQDQILLNHPQHVGNSLADTPVTPASEEDKELMDLEFLNDDENLHDGDQIQVELEGGSPILNTRIFEGRGNMVSSRERERSHLFYFIKFLVMFVLSYLFLY